MDTAERLQSTHALQDQVLRLERELAEANAQLHRSRELASLGEMAAGIAHEIRNPLASIQLYAEVLAEDLAELPQQADLCGKIDRSVRRMDVIVRDVLQFARESTVRIEPLVVSELMDRVVAEFGGSDRIRITVASQPDILVDASLMVQAAGNIVRNGLESMESDPTGDPLDITVDEQRLRRPDGTLQGLHRLPDRGPRMRISESDQERLFNPFFTTPGIRDGARAGHRASRGGCARRSHPGIRSCGRRNIVRSPRARQDRSR